MCVCCRAFINIIIWLVHIFCIANQCVMILSNKRTMLLQSGYRICKYCNGFHRSSLRSARSASYCPTFGAVCCICPTKDPYFAVSRGFRKSPNKLCLSIVHHKIRNKSSSLLFSSLPSISVHNIEFLHLRKFSNICGLTKLWQFGWAFVAVYVCVCSTRRTAELYK